MNKQRVVSIVVFLVLSLLASTAVLAAGCSSNKAVPGKSIFETPTPSIFDEPKTQPPLPPETATSPPSPATPAPVTVTEPPPPPTPSPAPATPSPAPQPALFTLTLKINNPNFGTVSIEPQEPANRYEKGTTVNLYAVPNSGSNFNGWTGDASGSSNSLSVVMDANKTIQGEFSKITFALNLNPAAGGAITLSPDGKSFDSGARVTVRAVPEKGFSFQSWSGDASGSENPLTLTMDREKRIAAAFAKAEYVLSVKVDPAGFIDATPAGNRHEGGTVVTLTARASPVGNYRFAGWSGAVTSSDMTVTVTMDSDKTLTAKFIRQFNLNVLTDGNGSVSPSSGTYDDGTQVIITATPNYGYEFAEWGGQGISGSSPTLTIVMNWDKSALATFRPLPPR